MLKYIVEINTDTHNLSIDAESDDMTENEIAAVSMDFCSFIIANSINALAHNAGQRKAYEENVVNTIHANLMQLCETGENNA